MSVPEIRLHSKFYFDRPLRAFLFVAVISYHCTQQLSGFRFRLGLIIVFEVITVFL